MTFDRTRRIVAAAFGLLSPAALASEDEHEHDEACDCREHEAMFSMHLDEAPAPAVDAPSADDFARVEAEWHAAVVKLDAASEWP